MPFGLPSLDTASAQTTRPGPIRLTLPAHAEIRATLTIRGSNAATGRVVLYRSVNGSPERAVAVTSPVRGRYSVSVKLNQRGRIVFRLVLGDGSSGSAAIRVG